MPRVASDNTGCSIFFLCLYVMNVQINNQDHQTEARNLQDLAIELQLPQKGVAVAIDNQMIPRGSWAQPALQEGARIVIIKAACGG